MTEFLPEDEAVNLESEAVDRQPIHLQYRRPDGTFVAIVKGYPYHVIPSDEPLWSEATARAAELGDALEFEPPPPAIELPPATKLSKADIWRRVTGEEAGALYTLLASITPAQPEMFRARMIFEAAQYLDTEDEDYPILRSAIVGALGETRADEVLAPNY